MTTEQVYWESRLIGQFCKVTTGGTPSTTKPAYWESGQVPWLSSGEVHKKRVRDVDSFITEQGLENSAAKLLPRGSVLVALAGQGKTRGTVAITEMATTTNQSVGAMIADAKVCDPEFLFFNLDSRYEELRALSGGAGRAGLNLQILKDVDVLLPPLPEQKKIASILTSVDEVIENTQKQIDKLQDLKKATMNELLTKGIGHTEFKESELGRIPKSWIVVKVGDLADFQNGKGFKSDEWSNKGLPIIRIQNLNGGEDFNYFAGEVDAKWHVPTGSLLFAWSGQRGKSFGARLWEGRDGVLNQHIFKVSENTDLVSKAFLHILLKHITTEIESDAHGFKDSFMHVTKGDITERVTAVPPEKEQSHIVAIFEALETKLTRVSAKYEQMQRLKKSLMQDLLTGKVRVSVD